MGDGGSLQVGLLRRRRIPEIALQVGDLRRGHFLLLHQLGRKIDAGAEEGVHRALRIGCHEDQRARRRRAFEGGGRIEIDPGTAELIIAHQADEGRRPAKLGDADQSVGRRAAGDLARRAHHGIEAFSPVAVDQRHDPLLQALAFKEGVVCAGEDIDDGIADAENVVARVGHFTVVSLH